jgi:hypothetical protein
MLKSLKENGKIRLQPVEGVQHLFKKEFHHKFPPFHHIGHTQKL